MTTLEIPTTNITVHYPENEDPYPRFIVQCECGWNVSHTDEDGAFGLAEDHQESHSVKRVTITTT